MRLAQRIAFLAPGALGLLFLLSPDAAATGLVMPAPPAADGAPVGRPDVLATLSALAVDARLGPSSAEVSERRTYALAPGYAGGNATVTFYQSVVGTGAPTITVGDRALGGTTLAPDAADAVRRRLTLQLRDPSPLRDLGTPLFVGDPLVLAVSATRTVEVVVTTSVPLAAHGTLQGLVLPIDWARPPVGTIDVKVSAKSDAPLRALFSPFHELAVVRDGANGAHATYSGRMICTDFDLTLLMSSGEGPVHLDLVPFRYGAAEGGYFLALVTPDPTPVTQNVLPRDIVFVLDTSGSMSGVKIAQAKEALRGVLGGLRPADSFALVSFSDKVRTFQSSVVQASIKNVADALTFVDGLQAAGGTNIYDALATALGTLPSGTGHPRYVVFLTDGQPTSGMTSIDSIVSLAATHEEVGARIFSFGIGDDVNTVLLDKLARQSSGDVLYVRPNQSVSVAVQDFFQRISDPVLADPKLDLGPFAVADLYPKVMSDLFAGRTVTLFGRYAVPGQGRITLAGSRGGQPWSVGFDVTLPEYALGDGYVPRIWAARHVGRLLADIKQGNADPALVDQTLAVAARFGVTTNFTTFAADAEGNVALRYAGVPMAASGSVAVDTSAALNGYGQSDAVRAASAPDLTVRYVSDRSLPMQGGYLTDTKLSNGETFVDLSFGSDHYFAFATAEAPWGAAGLLAAGPNARFELLGRAFRITDPVAPAASVMEVPQESSMIPGPLWLPVGTTPTAATPTETGGPGASVGGGDLPPPAGAGGPAPIAEPVGLANHGAGCGCSTIQNGDRAHGAALLVILTLLVRRRRISRVPHGTLQPTRAVATTTSS
jgi:MYXO-CTERM domain-containing protein